MRKTAKYQTFLNLIQSRFDILLFFAFFSNTLNFKKLQGCQKSSWAYVMVMKNIPWHQGNTSVKKIMVIRHVELEIIPGKCKIFQKLLKNWIWMRFRKVWYFAIFLIFLVRPLTLNSCRVAKNHFRHNYVIGIKNISWLVTSREVREKILQFEIQ